MLHEVDCLVPSSAEVMNEWSYAPLVCPHGMDRDNFTFVANKKKDVLYLDVVSITVNVFLTNKTNWYVHQAVGKCKSCNALGHAEVNIKYFDMATILLLV